MTRRPEDALFAQITDPVERALQRELFRLESELAHNLHLQNDRPWKDSIELQKEAAVWMQEHANEPAKLKLKKLDEFAARSKPIERRIARWKSMDSIALMDREFDLRRQMEEIMEHRQRRAWYESRQHADDTMLAKWRVFISLEEPRFDALAKIFRKRAQKARIAV
jgi:hypothetical protein